MTKSAAHERQCQRQHLVVESMRGFSMERRSRRGSSAVLAAGHFDPVQFLFHLMKRIIADLVTCTHGENSLARRLNGSAVKVAVGESSGFAFFRIGIHGSQ